jgi:predicted RNase H-like HicB family nuclease
VELTAVYIPVPEGFVAFIEELPGANTQAPTMDEARENLREAVTLVLEANRELSEQAIGNQTVSKEPFALPSS